MTGMRWPIVPFGEVAFHRKQFIQVQDEQRYQRCRVQLHARGVVVRDHVSGSDIKTKSQQVCRVDDFLVAEIDAKQGGYGLIPSDLEGAIVSSHYFLFSIRPERMIPAFLGWFARSKSFFQQIAAQGSTNYSAVRPQQILAFRIPLPPLDKQRRFVARLDAVSARLKARAEAAERQEAELAAMLQQAFARITAGSPRARMADVAPLVRRPIEVEPDGQYQELGIRSFGRGPFHKPSLNGLDAGSKRLFRIEPGDLVFNIVFAWEGAVAIARPEDTGRVGSHRFLTCVANETRVSAEILRFWFLSREGLAALGQASPGGAGRNRTLGLDALSRIEVPIPSRDAQAWFEALHSRASTLRAHNAAAAEDATALLPAMLHEIFGQTTC